MGGESRKQDLKNCKSWKAREVVWQILVKGNVTPYLERLHGFKSHLTKAFFKNWFESRVMLHSVIVNLTEDFIAKVTSLLTNNLK